MPRTKEHLPSLELAPELIQRFITTFFNRRDSYALQRDQGSYYRVTQPLTVQKVTAHLRGLLTLGTYALDQHSQARWLCFDADTQEQWQGLKTLTAQLEAEGVIPYLERSSRGGHLWLFTTPLPSKDIRHFGKALLRKYHIPSLEIYPKQDHLQGGVGSLVRLPLGIHRKTGQRYPFITSDEHLLAPTLVSQLELLASPLLVPLEFIQMVASQEQAPSNSRDLPEVLLPRKPDSVGSLSERIKNEISVYDFIRHYVELDERGKGLCPFHEDRIRSFQVNIRDNYWHCYAGCGGGSIIDFWMKWRHLEGLNSSFLPTVTQLASTLL